MAHNLFGERFLGHREPAWHGLGKTFEDPITAIVVGIIIVPTSIMLGYIAIRAVKDLVSQWI